MLIHSVYFWIKPDADPALAQDFRQGLERLITIPEIKAAHIGKPESTPPRAVIDSSYDWALVEFFDDLAAHDRYQVHEIHQAFGERYSSIWAKVQVYDVRL